MNTSRNTILDVARGFTVFIMPGVHSLQYYGNERAHRSWVGEVLGFLVEGPGAQLFMFLMGKSLTLGKRKTTANIIRRSSRLLIQELLLNIVRLIIPYKIGLIPEKLLQDAGLARSDNRICELLLTGDILQCAPSVI